MSGSKDIRNNNGTISNKNLSKYILKQNKEALRSYATIHSGGIESIMMDDEGLSGFSNTDSRGRRQSKKKAKFNTVRTIESVLNKRILGQDHAINQIVEQITVPITHMNKTGRPLRSLMLCGPTGTGKTETAKILAKKLFHRKVPLIRIDMSEFASEHEYSKLLGAPPGYVGYSSGGALTEAVYKNPRSVVLLDEIEKAHPEIWNKLLQVLDAGRMTDGTGKVVDFSQTLIIMTSNLGASEMSRTRAGFSLGGDEAYQDRQTIAHNAVMRAVKNTMNPEMVGRIDKIVVFNEISKDTARKIVLKELSKIQERQKKEGREVTFSSHDIVDEILRKSNVREGGVRSIQKTIDTMIATPLSKVIENSQEVRNLTLEVSPEGKVLVHETTKESEQTI